MQLLRMIFRTNVAHMRPVHWHLTSDRSTHLRDGEILTREDQPYPGQSEQDLIRDMYHHRFLSRVLLIILYFLGYQQSFIARYIFALKQT